VLRVVLAGVVGVVAVTGAGASATTNSATTTSTTSAAAAAATASSGPTASSPSATPATLCPSTSVWIPPTGPGGFRMGKGTRGEHSVVLTQGFCMDAAEISVRQFAACVDEGACKEPWKADPYSMYPAKLDYPVNLVSWPKARAYCAWTGERLPTEAEWEWAATGPEQSKYPWGDEPDPSCDYVDYTKLGAPKWAAGADVGCGGGGPSPVGAHPKGDRLWPGGSVHDLAGNVWEWTEDSFAPYSTAPRTDPVVRTSERVHVIRGGGWNRSYAAMVVTFRGEADYAYQVPALGFRCVRGAPLASPSPSY
jgi:formylglycine-generating enzyme required for sulfatase activity